MIIILPCVQLLCTAYTVLYVSIGRSKARGASCRTRTAWLSLPLPATHARAPRPAGRRGPVVVSLRAPISGERKPRRLHRLPAAPPAPAVWMGSPGTSGSIPSVSENLWLAACLPRLRRVVSLRVPRDHTDQIIVISAACLRERERLVAIYGGTGSSLFKLGLDVWPFGSYAFLDLRVGRIDAYGSTCNV